MFVDPWVTIHASMLLNRYANELSRCLCSKIWSEHWQAQKVVSNSNKVNIMIAKMLFSSDPYVTAVIVSSIILSLNF